MATSDAVGWGGSDGDGAISVDHYGSRQLPPGRIWHEVKLRRAVQIKECELDIVTGVAQ